ncbi:MAG: hypothetical protein GYB67_10895 [Chloroflexi bacterium]|nr:hypothetical protein [Chloroflexota bacterium]
MTPDTDSPQDYFRMLLITVVGQAFAAAGYQLEERQTQWAGGRFRFVKPLDDGLYSFIEFQHLHYVEGGPSRFRVNLIRTDQPNPHAPSDHPRRAERALSALVVADFGVAILPSADHWWGFHNVTELGNALAEAGHLAVGYGMPWLAGDLEPSA